MPPNGRWDLIQRLKGQFAVYEKYQTHTEVISEMWLLENKPAIHFFTLDLFTVISS